MMTIRILATTLIMRINQIIETPVSKPRPLWFKFGTAQYETLDTEIMLTKDK